MKKQNAAETRKKVKGILLINSSNRPVYNSEDQKFQTKTFSRDKVSKVSRCTTFPPDIPTFRFSSA